MSEHPEGIDGTEPGLTRPPHAASDRAAVQPTVGERAPEAERPNPDAEIAAGLNHLTHAKVIGACATCKTGNIEAIIVANVRRPYRRQYCSSPGCPGVVPLRGSAPVESEREQPLLPDLSPPDYLGSAPAQRPRILGEPDAAQPHYDLEPGPNPGPLTQGDLD